MTTKEWEEQNLGFNGHYMGPELTAYGFPYARGVYVPIDARFSALLSWQWALRAQKMATAGDVPDTQSCRECHGGMEALCNECGGTGLIPI